MKPRGTRVTPEPPQNVRVTWVFWITRDSYGGQLAAKCTVWTGLKPLRVHVEDRVTWVDSDHRQPALVGEYTSENVALWWRTYPETDREIIKVETFASQRELEEQRKRFGNA